MKKLENYLKCCYGLKTKIIKKYQKIIPKVSIISPIYNRKSYILRFLRSIQYQRFRDLEIILVDDCSVDNTLTIINNYSNRDNRIITIKDKKIKGTFITRNIGVIFSKGKYIIIPDPDDIINKNIISICYKYAEKFKYDIIKFNIYMGKGKIKDNEAVTEIINHKIYKINQPKLSTSIFYIDNTINKIIINS